MANANFVAIRLHSQCSEIRASCSLSGMFVSIQIPVEEQPENANGLSYTQNTGLVYI